MSNLEKLNNVFISTFEIESNGIADAAYKKTDLWDSVGQMSLVANLEDEFGIMIDSEDIMDINSYVSAKAILSQKYNIQF